MYQNRKAWLTMTGISEGTVTSPLTKNSGYDVIVTGVSGPEVFSDYSSHPFAVGPDPASWRAPKVINSSGLSSTASGRYQILRRYWLSYAKQLGLKDFGPDSQDAYVMQQLRERSALPLIDGGYFDAAMRAVSGLWASFPGKPYPGQQQHPLDHLRSVFVASGGLLTAT